MERSRELEIRREAKKRLTDFRLRITLRRHAWEYTAFPDMQIKENFIHCATGLQRPSVYYVMILTNRFDTGADPGPQ